MICNDCGLPFDESDLSQVFEHEHRGLKLNLQNVKSKKVIKHAREVYPNCSIQFSCGVHTWINEGDDFDQRLMYQHEPEFKQGYWQAKVELEDNYTLR